MSKIYLLLALLISALGVEAQSTKVITGAVIDKNGNPLPNALVEATGGAESVTTDADGTYRIEVPVWLKSLTAKYAGLRDKKIRIKNKSHLIFELEPETVGSWFLDAAFSANYGLAACKRAGLMGGYLGRWGGYAKLLIPVSGWDRRFHPAATAGVIRHITNPIYLYLGLGYTAVYGRWEREPWEDTQPGAAFEGGAIFKFNKLNLSVGYACNSSFGNFINHSFQASVGFCFR